MGAYSNDYYNPNYDWMDYTAICRAWRLGHIILIIYIFTHGINMVYLWRYSLVVMEIRYITPFSTERNKLGYPNIGGEYNKCVAELPDDCYVCIRDGDTMFLTNDWGEHIKAIIEENPTFDLITCATNRVGLKHHCCGEHFYNSPDITEHIIHAHKLKESFGNEVYTGSKNYPITVAPGYFMLFHKSLWTKVGGFPEYDITFDRVFSEKVIKSGGKIGIATGLYIFHLYRFGKDNPQNDIKHLRKRK